MGSSLPRLLFILLLAASAIGALSGCARLQGASSVSRPPGYASPPGTSRAAPMNPNRSTPLPSSTRTPGSEWTQSGFEDLPIPPGFSLEQDASFTFVQGPLRRADLRYEGSEPVSRVIRFYQEAMKTHGWSFLRLTGVQMKTLTYVKNDELCEVMIESHSEAHSEGGHHAAERPRQADAWKDSEAASTTHLHIKLGLR